METVKPWWQSKIILVNLLMAIAGVIAVFKPEVAAVIKEYSAESSALWAILNIVLRLITKDRVSIS
jgi:hypothetical protein